MSDGNSKSKLIIIGASGHGRVIADIAVLMGYQDIVFLDDDESVKECGGFPVVGKTGHAESGEIIVAVGNADDRKRLTESFKGRSFPVLVHPSAVVARDAVIGEGSVVMAGSVINPGARIGRGVIVNTCSSIDHDCIVGDYCHISVGSHLGGTVALGESTWIGIGAVVCNNVNICSSCMIGAGAVVTKDINEPGTYIGVPARLKG